MIRQRKPLRRTPLARKHAPRPRSTLREFLNADGFKPAIAKRKTPKHRPRRNVVHVELNTAGQVEVIIRNCNQKSCQQEAIVQHMPRAEATGQLRERVWERDGHKCRKCGKEVTLDDMQLHEVLARGKRDAEGHKGLMSMANSINTCRICHGAEHSERAPRLKWLLL